MWSEHRTRNRPTCIYRYLTLSASIDHDSAAVNSHMSLRQKIAYAGRHFTPTWRYGFNLKSTFAYRGAQAPRSAEARRVLTELNEKGIAITSAQDLLPDLACYAELMEAVEALEQEWAERIASARAFADSSEVGKKTFLLKLLGEKPRLDPHSIYVRFALQEEILGLANAYFGMFTQLRYYNVWHTLTTTGPARESQLWHFDREDHLILKVFVYCSDVDDSAGPFTYAPGTHVKGRVHRLPKSFVENGVRRWEDDQMSALLAKEHWIRATGSKGCIVFADTRGYHKGGLARGRDRILYQCLFTSPAAQVAELFERPQQIDIPTGRAQALALRRG